MNLVYSLVHHRVKCGSIVPGMQEGHENISYGLSILYYTAQVSFLCLRKAAGALSYPALLIPPPYTQVNGSGRL